MSYILPISAIAIVGITAMIYFIEKRLEKELFQKLEENTNIIFSSNDVQLMLIKKRIEKIEKEFIIEDEVVETAQPQVQVPVRQVRLPQCDHSGECRCVKLESPASIGLTEVVKLEATLPPPPPLEENYNIDREEMIDIINQYKYLEGQSVDFAEETLSKEDYVLNQISMNDIPLNKAVYKEGVLNVEVRLNSEGRLYIERFTT